MGVVELVVASVHLSRTTANNTFYIFLSLVYFDTAKTSSLDSAMNCVLLLPILVFAVLISSAHAARAPDPGFLNAFQQPASVFRARRQQQQQQQPGVLGCLTPCTRELRPVRGHQGGREKILPNPCTFQAAQCQARRTRGPPLIKDPNQDDVIFPSI